MSQENAIVHKHRFAVWAVVALAVLAVSSYFFIRSQGNTPAEPPEKATIAFAMPHVLVAVAHMQDFFADEGLAITLILTGWNLLNLKQYGY